MRGDYTARIIVWDETLQKIIFWKDCLSVNPRIDLLSELLRDMRTTTRKAKCIASD